PRRAGTAMPTQKRTADTAATSSGAPSGGALGAKMSVSWNGPANPRDYITFVKAGAAEGTYGRYEYVSKGNPIAMTAPDAPGEYEARYLSAQSNKTLARARFVVGSVNASISGPAEITAGERFKVSWKGPDNRRNFITVVHKGAREGEFSAAYAYTAPQGNRDTPTAPIGPGYSQLRDTP